MINKPRNNFIDESFMSPHGEPIEFEKSDFYGRVCPPGLTVMELTWEQAGHYFEDSAHTNVEGRAGKAA